MLVRRVKEARLFGKSRASFPAMSTAARYLNCPPTTVLMGPMNHRLQAWVLRLIGTVEIVAFAAVLLPRSQMEAIYARLDVGTMPDGPVFEAVMRCVSFAYGMFGVGMWFVASDVVRYRPLVVVTALGYLLAA